MKEAVIYPIESPIHPRSVEGRFRRYKNAILALAYAVYFGLPWLPWTREVGPNQTVLFDIADRKFYLFGLTIQPEQVFWLAGLLVIAALILFFVTSLAGRVFCGYFCFQTLWTDIFQQIERFVQGERPARMRLEKQGWDAEKIRKKGLTWALYFLVAFGTAMTFTLYWGEAGDLVTHFFTGEAATAMYVTVLILTATTFAMAGLVRESVCMHICPYSRFQGAMVDKNTRIVAYDRIRGEGANGRAKPEKQLKIHSERQQAGAGDCVDCGYCVQVCPTGVDIREGMQAGCIHCGLCIDACDNIMERYGWDKGLIRYSSEQEDKGDQVSFFTFKNIGYAVTLLLTTVALIYSIATKPPIETSVHQIRNPLFVQLSDGRIQNSYEIKLRNQTDQRQAWQLSVEGLTNAELSVGQLSSIEVAPLQSLTVFAQVKRQAQDDPNEITTFSFVATPTHGSELRAVKMAASFYAP